MKTKKATRATSAKANVKNNDANQVKNINAVMAVNVQAESESPVIDLPVAKDSSNKVSSKEVLKSASGLREAVKEERRGANVTIRLIAERAAAGDINATNILCALCDVPRTALYSLNINIVRAAVNAYYPYYIEVDGRKVSVKPAGVWYSTEPTQVGKVKANEPIEEAAKRVKRGYRAVTVVDYLDQLIKAAKSRAKGITPRCVDDSAIYNDIALSETAEGITAKDIDDAKARRAYSPNAANVWHKDRNGFYI